ncbi:hypothetical protein [Actinomadura hibisca]|uniref:hypothetical protein n=1 Tax=Actinomadura hibisca TaxID=68565 RepID=UPI0012FA2CB2|nr:hypothetical protein [Actinomadura hibisca]
MLTRYSKSVVRDELNRVAAQAGKTGRVATAGDDPEMDAKGRNPRARLLGNRLTDSQMMKLAQEFLNGGTIKDPSWALSHRHYQREEDPSRSWRDET